MKSVHERELNQFLCYFCFFIIHQNQIFAAAKTRNLFVFQGASAAWRDLVDSRAFDVKKGNRGIGCQSLNLVFELKQAVVSSP